MKLAEHKKTLIITSLLTLLPVVIGIFLWPQLPEQIATHFNSSGQPDDYSPKIFAVVGLPLILLIAQWIGVAATFADPKRQNIHPKVFHIIMWIMPVVSIFVCSATYSYALGIAVDISSVCTFLMGFIFLIFGNYLPKCPQNYSIGFKLSWTLDDTENWAKTHRFAGFIWIILGAVTLVCGFLKYTWIIIVVLPIAVLVPTIYSYIFYLKKKNSTKED